MLVEHPRLSVIFNRHEIAATVVRLSDSLNIDYRGKSPLLIGILKGSFVFMADLIRLLQMPVEVEFVTLSSYGKRTESSGSVKIVKGIHSPIKDREIIVVEDIVDSGITLQFFLDYLNHRKPASVRVCALLDKVSQREVPLHIDYVGLVAPNKFLVGYGLDWGERFRHLPEIYAMEAP